MTSSSKAPITLAQPSDTDPAIIIFGTDDSGKPHASTFNIDQRHDAIKAAGLMGFRALAVDGETLIALAAKIPAGKVFSSGKGFVPFVKREVGAQLDQFATDHPDQLITVPASVEDASSSPADSDASNTGDVTAAGAQPKDWTDIKVGSRVLAVDDPEDGWWVAIVQHVHESGTQGHRMAMLTLEWEVFPDDAAFTRRFDRVALIHPSYPFDTDGEGAA
jgi:hypothetical protein